MGGLDLRASFLLDDGALARSPEHGGLYDEATLLLTAAQFLQRLSQRP